MRKQNLWTIICCFLLLFGKASYGQTSAEKVNKLLREEMEKQKIPGLQLVVIDHSKIVLSEAMGVANVPFSVPATRNTIFSINSIAKVFTGTAIMQLVEEGKIEIEKPVSAYLDSLPESWKQVSVSQLLGHISGLPDIEDDFTSGLVGNKGEDTAWKVVQTLPVPFQPGEKFSYNATNYLLLQKIIEKYGQLPFEQFIQKYQLNKVGMKRTLFGNSFDVVKGKAPTYSYYFQDKNMGEYIKEDQLLEVYENFPKIFRADAGMFSTAEDIGYWILALMDNQLLKEKKSIKTMWSPVLLNDGKMDGFGGILNGYGLGWPVVERSRHRAVAPIGGGRAAFMIYPDDDIAIVLLTNLSGCFPELIIDKIAKIYFTN